MNSVFKVNLIKFVLGSFVILAITNGCKKEEEEVVESGVDDSIVTMNYYWDTVRVFRRLVHDFENHQSELWVGGEFFTPNLGSKHGFAAQIGPDNSFDLSYYMTFNTPIIYPNSTPYGITKLISLGDTTIVAGGVNLGSGTYEGIFSKGSSGGWFSQFNASLPGDFQAFCQMPHTDTLFASMALSNYDGVIRFVPRSDIFEPIPAYSLVGPGFDGKVRDLIMYNGELYACGDFIYSGGVALNFIARYANGAWHSLGSGLFGPARKMLVIDNELYVVGTFSAASGVAGTGGIAKWNGVNWKSVSGGLGGQGIIEDLVVTENEQLIVVGGDFNHNGMQNVAYHTENGWKPFSSSVTGQIKAIEIYNDHIYIGMRHNMNADSSSILVWDL